MTRKTLLTKATAPADLGDDEAEITISTVQKDRDGDVLVPEGCEYADYLRVGGPVFYGHDYHELPVARTRELIVKPGVGIRARFAWLTDDPFAARVRNAFQQRVLGGASVGFIPKEQEPIATGYLVRRWSLLEFSLTGIPSNAYATRTLKGLGLMDVRDDDELDVDPQALRAIVRRVVGPGDDSAHREDLLMTLDEIRVAHERAAARLAEALAKRDSLGAWLQRGLIPRSEWQREQVATARAAWPAAEAEVAEARAEDERTGQALNRALLAAGAAAAEEPLPLDVAQTAVVQAIAARDAVRGDVDRLTALVREARTPAQRLEATVALRDAEANLTQCELVALRAQAALECAAEADRERQRPAFEREGGRALKAFDAALDKFVASAENYERQRTQAAQHGVNLPPLSFFGAPSAENVQWWRATKIAEGWLS